MSGANGNDRRQVQILVHHIPRPKGREKTGGPDGLTPKQFAAALRAAEKRILQQRREIAELRHWSSAMNNALRILVKRLLPTAAKFARKGRPRLLAICAKIADQVSTIPKTRPR